MQHSSRRAAFRAGMWCEKKLYAQKIQTSTGLVYLRKHSNMQTRKRKWLRRSLIGLGIGLALFLALGIHLYQVTDHFYAPQGPQYQLARIDFYAPLNAEEITQVRSAVQHLPGVQKAYYNTNDHILVYAYTVGELDQQRVYDQLMQNGNYTASRFIPDQQMLASGCPVLSDNSSSLLNLYKELFSIFL